MVSASRPRLPRNGTRAINPVPPKSTTPSTPYEIGYFGTLNPTDGGNSQRYSLPGWVHHQGTNSESRMRPTYFIMIDLFSDFTYTWWTTTEATSSNSRIGRWVGGLTHTTLSFTHGLAANGKLRSPATPQRLDQQRLTRRKIACARSNYYSAHRHLFQRHHLQHLHIHC